MVHALSFTGNPFYQPGSPLPETDSIPSEDGHTAVDETRLTVPLEGGSPHLYPGEGVSHDLNPGEGVSHDLNPVEGVSHDLNPGEGVSHDLNPGEGVSHDLNSDILCTSPPSDAVETAGEIVASSMPPGGVATPPQTNPSPSPQRLEDKSNNKRQRGPCSNHSPGGLTPSTPPPPSPRTTAPPKVCGDPTPSPSL